MIIVSNTGPLIGLAKIGQLQLPSRLASGVYVPPQVEAELLAKSGPEFELLAEALTKTIQVRTIVAPDPATTSTLKHLDEGERQTITLARSLPSPVLLLLDDRAGRSAARKLGCSLTGLGGLLVLAKRQELVAEVAPLLTLLRNKGYWISDEVVNVLKRLAGE